MLRFAQDKLLIVPDKSDPERDRVVEAWEQAGGESLKLGRFWEPPVMPSGVGVRLYGPEMFCLVLAQQLELTLTSPPDALLASTPRAMLLRRVEICALDKLATPMCPCFIKPVTPELFEAGIHQELSSVLALTHGLPATEPLYVSEIVSFVAEARAFILNAQVLTIACYEGDEPLEGALALLNAHLPLMALPRACVLDVGMLADGRWALIEANSAWGAGCNGCAPVAVARCVEAACRARHEL